MRNILTIFKKEWDRVIKDKRLMFTVIFLPGVMIYIIYSFMGFVMTNAENNVSDIAIVNTTDGFKNIYEANETADNLNVISIELSEVSDYEALIDQKEWAMLIVFPENLLTYDGTGEKPAVYVYSNPNDLTSSSVSSRFVNYLITYQTQLSYDLFGDTNYFVLNHGSTPINESVIMGAILAQLMPMLVIMFLFSGAMSIGPEAISGEKERGTFATILITPIKRKELALGKILGLSVLSLLSAISSFIGILLSLPKLINYGDANISIYGFSDYLMILLILFSTIFVIIGIISMVSAYAKSVKEASAYITPVYILTIIISIATSFSGASNPHILTFVLPIYNSVVSLGSIMTFSELAWAHTLITVISNFIYLTLFVSILNRMFNSEKIMFAK